MYTEGNILYFTPFYFKNGQTPKSKFFVVLKIIGEKTILASLPTSKDYIPTKDEIDMGCIELADIGLNCFVISSDINITECNKRFDVQTFIYGHELDTYDLASLKSTYRIELSDYEIFGKMQPAIFSELIKCLKNSKSVKQKYLKAL
jgi:hypothetical protein